MGAAAPGLIVVKVPASYSDADAATLASSVGASVLRAIPFSPHYYIFQMNSVAAATKAAGIRAITRAASVTGATATDEVKAAVATLIKTAGVLASPDYIKHITQTSPAPAVTGPTLAIDSNDPLYYPSNLTTTGQTWNMTMVHMPQAWAVQTNAIGRAVTVAVLDTGTDVTHPDLINHIAAGGMDFTPPDLVVGGVVSTTVIDDNGHGTHCSGVISAQTDNGVGVVGVGGWNRNNVNVQILPLKVADEFGEIFEDAEIAAIGYATAQKVDVLSMSFGGGAAVASDLTTDPEYAALLTATNAGITAVAALGNDGVELNSAVNIEGFFYPAEFPNVIAVSAVGPTRNLASYSNFGGTVAIAAPGGDDPTFSDPSKMVLSTYSRNPTAVAQQASSGYPVLPIVGYATDQGTSMACPHVAGAAALLIAAGATENYTNIKSVLQAHAQVLDETPSLTGGNKYGAGLLDVYASLTSLSTLNPAFTAQLSDVVDNEVTTLPATSSTPSSGSTGYSLVASEPYTDRGLAYVRPQAPFTIRYLGRTSLIDTAGVDHPEYVTLDISPATLPTSILRHFVGSTGNSSTTFALPSLPSGSNPASVLTATVPSTTALNLPDGNYLATLKVFDSSAAVNAFVNQGAVFFEVGSHTQPQGLTMFASPFQVDTSIVGTLPPELFEFGTGSTFTLERYNAQRLPTDLEYAQYSPTPNAVQNTQAQFATPLALNGSPISYFVSNPNTSIAPVGLGYWLSLDKDVTLNPTGQPINSAIAIKLFAANGGWNMIGGPFTYSVLWPSASVLSANGSSYSLQGAADQGIISPAIVGYTGGQYVYSVAPSGSLDPFQGYWVRAYQDCTLIFAPSTTSSRAAHTAASTRATTVHSQLPGVDGWRARMTATVAGDRDGENYFGVLRSASVSEHYYDIPKPPSGGGHAYLRFTKADPSGRAEVYAMDMRKDANASPSETWTAQVSTDKTDSPVTLAWDGLGTLPHGTELYLTDVTTGKKVSMHSRSSYTFSSGVAGSTRSFQITMQHELSAGPLSITNFQVVPGSRALGASRAFRFTANQDAQVTAVVRALNGREVATLSTSETRAEATKETLLHWNGRKADGSALPTGMYFIEVTLTTPDGQKATVKQPFTSLN